ncbi:MULTISPECIES: S-methyl-5-thioribose kinase [unclassified Bacillus (in: firmicutes)]|uniref:S-methyl-5-thioribose kinase n=1 Tax=unclassified Bacillus (in: firmicutes) TaxID=185979 RepID=UPI000BF23146|nr:MULTISPECIES: S-methyl-5-thioribose kinase [unclassified Bacillus (in: firmicutes)]PEJ47753.1 S-methyl-5-thioribose kinase [Bacillus sp. AFS002410]PEK98309.1 S-methyl-5-thioribose kinase [Bacillus sp. AFS017336]
MTVIQRKEYRPLTEATAVTYLQKLGYFTNELCESVEIGDGNLNLVFKVTPVGSEKGLIIKQALPYAKVVGESWPLTLNRATIESNATKIYNDLIPLHSPEILEHDEEQAVTVMEDLSHLQILRKGLIEKKSYPFLAEHIGEFLAKSLFFTSDFGTTPAKKKELEYLFNNPELCDITENLVYTDPYFNCETNSYEEELTEVIQELWNDEALQIEVAKLKLDFLSKKEALLHGDLHTGSIFVSATETKVIDPEFAFVGPIGFDLGQIQANLIFQLFSRTEQKEEIVEHILNIEKVFNETFIRLWEEHSVRPFNQQALIKEKLEGYWVDAIGVIGCELIRRSIGLAHVEDIDSLEENQKIQVKKKVLKFGAFCIKNRFNISNIGNLLIGLEK